MNSLTTPFRPDYQIPVPDLGAIAVPLQLEVMATRMLCSNSPGLLVTEISSAEPVFPGNSIFTVVAFSPPVLLFYSDPSFLKLSAPFL